jgi:hypothetical protein
MPKLKNLSLTKELMNFSCAFSYFSLALSELSGQVDHFIDCLRNYIANAIDVATVFIMDISISRASIKAGLDRKRCFIADTNKNLCLLLSFNIEARKNLSEKVHYCMLLMYFQPNYGTKSLGLHFTMVE